MLMIHETMASMRDSLVGATLMTTMMVEMMAVEATMVKAMAIR